MRYCQSFIDSIKSVSYKEFENKYKIEYLELINKDSWHPLHQACRYGRVELVKNLLSNHCQIHARNKSGYQAIHLACKNDHIDIVKILIENKCDINASDYRGYQPIHLACKNGHIDIVKILIENKCDINASDKRGYQPIHLACKNGHIDIVKILIGNKCYINRSDIIRGYQPIHLACKNGHIDIVKILIENKCDINASNEGGYQPIHWACGNGHIDIVKTLIEKKCHINACDENGYQPIHLACENGHINIVKILISNNCEIKALTKNGESPIDIVKQKGYQEIIDIIISADPGGYQAIHIACENGYVDILKSLIVNKCNINTYTNNGNKPIHLACKNGHIDILKILIENKCDINASDKIFGYQPIHLASENGHIDIVKILIENKCDINASDKINGYQPIHLACKNGHIDIVKILIENKCDINASDKINGNQPIHLVCKNGYIDIVEILIDNKCEMRALTKYGESPIDIAKQNGHQQIIDIIISANPIESIVSALNLQCTINCDHKFCLETLHKKKLPKGESIGSGSFGEIYKYKISNTNREIVVKKSKNISEDKKNIEININKFSSQIIHQNIVRYFGALEKSGKLFIFMEYISGGSLKNLIDKIGSIQINKVIQYSKQILVGLEFLHHLAIIHRDIKPGNILLAQSETLKLADFGLSRSLQKSFSKSIEQANSFCGSSNYLAPEIFLGEPYDYPSDIWSTGATIIHMLSGKMPYHNLRPEAVMFIIGTTKKIEFTSCEPISDTMVSFINDMLTPNQLKRPCADVLLNHSIFDIL